MSIIPPDLTTAAVPSFSGYAGSPNDLPGVGFWPRVAARMIDFVVQYALAFLSGAIFVVFLAIASGGHISKVVLFRLQQTTISAIALTLLGSVLYEIICEAMHGSTLGKFVLSMVVVQEDGSRCSTRSAVIRSFAYFIDGLFFGIVGYMEMKKSFREQRHGDEWAHTIVCKRHAVPAGKLAGTGQFIGAFLLAAMAYSAMVIVGLVLKIT